MRLNPRRIFFISGMMVAMLLYAILWVRMVASPEERTGSDFISAYTAGRVADLWGAEAVYDLEAQQEVQETVVGFPLADGQVLMYNHPPYLIPLLAVLMDEAYVASMYRYAFLMVVLYAIGLGLCHRLLGVNGWTSRPTFRAVAGMGISFPVFVSLLNTQDTAILVLGGIMVVAGMIFREDWLAGLGLALMTVRPHVAMMLILPFLFRRRRIFAWVVGFGIILGGISLLAVGTQGIRTYLDLLLTAAGGEFHGMNEAAMVNLIGLLWRHFPFLGGDAIHWIGWAGYLAAAGSLCISWWRSKQVDERHFGLAVLLAIFFVPHLHYHDLSLLLIPMVVVLLVLVRGAHTDQENAALLPMAASLFLLLGSLIPGWKATIPAALLLLLGLGIGHPEVLTLKRKSKSTG